MGQEFWMEDGHVSECYQCAKPFSLFVRRHHCRLCGHIFCANCVNHSVNGRCGALCLRRRDLHEAGLWANRK